MSIESSATPPEVANRDGLTPAEKSRQGGPEGTMVDGEQAKHPPKDFDPPHYYRDSDKSGK